MPASAVRLPAPALTRRRFLAGVGSLAMGAGAVACTADGGPDPSPPTTPTATPAPDPDARRRSDAVATAGQLATAYEATLVVHPALTTALSPLLADHLAHSQAVAPDATPSPSPRTHGTTTRSAEPGPSSPGASAPAGPRASPSTSSAVPVPGDPAAARAALQTLEREASEAARVGAIAAVDPAFARLLASISASRAVHAVLLGATA